jgi:DhnA family fructose-bisphosphate aldolase class Ia
MSFKIEGFQDRQSLEWLEELAIECKKVHDLNKLRQEPSFKKWKEEMTIERIKKSVESAAKNGFPLIYLKIGTDIVYYKTECYLHISKICEKLEIFCAGGMKGGDTISFGLPPDYVSKYKLYIFDCMRTCTFEEAESFQIPFLALRN